MGGAFDVGGNVFLDDRPSATVAEWNVFIDPAAAQALLDSGLPVTFVPLDAQVGVDAYVVRTLAREASTRPARVIARLLASDPFFVSGEFAFWDPLAAIAVANPQLFIFDARRARVVTAGPDAGRTVSGPARWYR